MKQLLILDNYDSFTYNLADYARQCSSEFDIRVIRNDEITLDEALLFDAYILSPGPGLPAVAGIMPALITALQHKKPLLGVCLGLQAIAEAYGGKLKNLATVLHGVGRPMKILHLNDPLYLGVPKQIITGRYHSWTADMTTLPEELIVTAIDEDAEIMSLRHRNGPVFGVQYHPESILTPWGKKIMSNFLTLAAHFTHI